MKLKTIADIETDPRIDGFIKDYDCRGRHMVECKPEYIFTSCASTVEIGSVSELCWEMNTNLITREEYNELHPITPTARPMG